MAKLALLAGLAVASGLALSGLNYVLIRLFEGYPLLRAKGMPGFRVIYQWLLGRQQRQFERLRSIKENDEAESSARTAAAFRLDRYFPRESHRLLPTSFGNAIRAFEEHAYTRYGLDGIAAYPRIQMLLSCTEREPLVEAETSVDVALNSVIGALLVGATLIVDQAVHTPQPWSLAWLYLIPFLAAYLFSLTLANVAVQWGAEVRAAIDLHRLELYAKLGVRRPTSFTEEHTIAKEVNYLLLYGERMSDSSWG